MSMTENDWKHELTYFSYFCVLETCFQSFSVILIRVVTFTVVIFGQF